MNVSAAREVFGDCHDSALTWPWGCCRTATQCLIDAHAPTHRGRERIDWHNGVRGAINCCLTTVYHVNAHEDRVVQRSVIEVLRVPVLNRATDALMCLVRYGRPADLTRCVRYLWPVATPPPLVDPHVSSFTRALRVSQRRRLFGSEGLHQAMVLYYAAQMHSAKEVEVAAMSRYFWT